MKIDNSLRADIQAVLGATGTGKSTYVLSQIKREKRLLIWDIKREYDQLESLQLDQILPRMHSGKPGRYRFLPSMDGQIRKRQFALFCSLVYGTESAIGVGNVRLVIEELRFVTTPSQSPEPWAALTCLSRARGVRIIGTSQRPAQIDKDFLGNCSYIRCGALEYPNDRKAVAPILRCSVDEIAALSGFQAREWRRAG